MASWFMCHTWYFRRHPTELRGVQREGQHGGPQRVSDVCLKIWLPDSGQYTNNSGILIFETNITHPLRSTMLSLSLYMYNERDNMVDLNGWVMFVSKIKMPLLLVYWPLSGSQIFRQTSLTRWGPPCCPSRCTPRSSVGWRRKYQVWHINQDAIIDRHLSGLPRGL